MDHRLIAPLWLAVGLAGCQPSLSAQADWAQWFSQREIADIAVSPDGDIVIGGYWTNQEYAPTDSANQATSRPFFARIGEDGTVLDSWTGFLGRVSSVAMDQDAGAYLMVRELRDDSDWEDPEHCELRALRPDGGMRWTKRWDGSCAHRFVVAGDVVAVQVDDRIEAFGTDGEARWQQPSPQGLEAPLSLSTDGTGIWRPHLVEQDDGNHVIALRYDAEGRETARLDVELGERRYGAFHPTEDGVLVVALSPVEPVTLPPPTEPRLTPHVQLLSVSLEGRLQWERTLADAVPERGARWARYVADLTAHGTTPWVISSELHSPQGSESESERRRIVVQRWSAAGEIEGTLRRRFVDANEGSVNDLEPEALARNQCVGSDVAIPLQLGSVAKTLRVQPDGSLLVVGRQGCRDSFLMHLEVEQ